MISSQDGGSDHEPSVDPKLKKLIFSLRQKIADQEAEITEQQSLMEHFILDQAPAKVPSIESKCLIQNLKTKIKHLEKKVGAQSKKHLAQQLADCETERNFYFDECLIFTQQLNKEQLHNQQDKRNGLTQKLVDEQSELIALMKQELQDIYTPRVKIILQSIELNDSGAETCAGGGGLD